jgi:hypothetical protein
MAQKCKALPSAGGAVLELSTFESDLRSSRRVAVCRDARARVCVVLHASREAASRSDAQRTPNISWNQKIHDHTIVPYPEPD